MNCVHKNISNNFLKFFLCQFLSCLNGILISLIKLQWYKMENSYNFSCSLHLGNICFLAAGLFYYENQTWFYSWCLFPVKLTAEKKVDRRLLPPKKILGKNSKSLVERRQKELELYLQTLLQQFPQATPTPLTNFLHFHLYVSTTYKQVCSSWFRITFRLEWRSVRSSLQQRKRGQRVMLVDKI